MCNCSGTQKLDPEAIEQAVGLPCSQVHSALCTDQIDRAVEEIGQGDAIICCQQEQRIFAEIAAETGAETPAFTDLRDRAGWSDDPRSKLPKMAALLAEATLIASLLVPAGQAEQIALQSARVGRAMQRMARHMPQSASRPDPPPNRRLH
jgi:hypothetical protein